MAVPSVSDIHVIVNSLVKQATGAPIASQDLSNVMSVGKTTFTTAPDQMLNALTQRIDKTSMSIRKYDRKFAHLRVDNRTFGNIARKIVPLPMEAVEELGLGDKLTDGTSVDDQTIRKRKVVQLNFYDQKAWMLQETHYRQQILTAFTNEAEFGSFLEAMMTARSNDVEAILETVARTCLINFLGGGLLDNKNGRVVHLLTEYNKLTGLELTDKTVFQPANFSPFARWMWSRIQTVSDLMTNRTTLFHTNLAVAEIPRHTPVRDQKLLMLSQFTNNIATSVMSDTFRTEYIEKYNAFEAVNFWQTPASPDEIDATCTYLQASGETKTGPIKKSKVIGALFDHEAVGYTTFQQSSSLSRYNAAGEYWNDFLHFKTRFWNDFTENGCVFCLD